MALENIFNTEPYFDDYNANKDFYRILFRPSYAVQARELTQMQTILQNQVTRFGNHVFKNGSQVIPGSVNVDNKVHFIKLKQFTDNVDVTTYIKEFKNKIVTGSQSGVKMRVLDTSLGGTVTENTDIPTLYCKIEGTADDNTTNRLVPGELLVAYAVDNQISTNFRLTEDQLGDKRAFIRSSGSVEENATTYTNNSSSDVIGYAYSVEVKAGIYYVDGVFVRNDDLKLYVGRFTNTPSCRVGFKVTEDTVTPEIDKSILDNAAGSSNFAAPGAHRYKISLSLVKLDLVATDSIKFIELVRIVDGRVQSKVEAASYAELEKTLARRTYDESGNYEVNKFKLSVREHLNDGSNFGVYPIEPDSNPDPKALYGNADKFVTVVDPGKAYVQGYEIESTASQYIEFDKARIINGQENNHVKRIARRAVGINIGNYVTVTNAFKAPSLTGGSAPFEKIYLLKTLQSKPAILSCGISAGVVNTVQITDGGSGYLYPAVPLTFSPISDAGTGAFATGVVNSNVVSVNVTNGGTGYTSTPTITVTSGGGSGAAITAVISGGVVTSFTITNAGSGYLSPPTIYLTNGGGVGATAYATVSGGAITSVVVVNGGSGYTTAPTVNLITGTGAGFACGAPVISGGVITSIPVSNSGTTLYSSPPTIAISGGGGSGATATAVLGNGTIVSIVGLVGGSSYAYAPSVRANTNITLGGAASASDIVGTARVKSYELDSGAYTGSTTAYKLGLFDINMLNGASFGRDVKSVIGSATTQNFAADIKFTESVISGAASITTGSLTITGSGTNFIDTVRVGDIICINGVKVGTVASLPTSNLAVTLTTGYTGTSITNGRVSIFTAFLEESQFDTLLFPVGQSNVKTLRGVENNEDTLKDSTIVTRRQFGMVNTVANKPMFEVTDQYETFLSDMDLAHYTLIDYNTNLPVNITESQISFDTTDASLRKKVYFSGVPNGNYYLIASINNVVSSAAERTKEIRLNYVQPVINKKDVSVPSIDLVHGDIFRLVSVRMTPGNYDTWNEATAVDITDRYTIDNGQRNTYYTYGKLLLKPGYAYPSGCIKITYDYFQITGTEGNYFSVDSYVDIPYDKIPSYYVTDPVTNKKIEKPLTDVVDFRPILTTTNGFTPEIPKIGSDLTSPLAYYVGRIDKLALDSFGKFNVIQGVPSAIPKEPEDPKEGMVLATVLIPPYTKDVGSIVIKQRENRRYTMADIGKLERRVSNLEYYVTLSLLEKDTATMQIRDSVTNLDRFKNGFIVDQFTGHGVGDVANGDYRVSIDSSTRVLRPMHNTVDLDIVEVLVSGTDRLYKPYKKTGDLITLSYEESPYIFNNNATRTMDIHAISMGAFKGQISLYPEGDNWKSTTRRPDLVVVDDNNYDAIKFMAEELGVTGTKWNEWQTNWTSITTTDSNPYETRTFDTSRGAWGTWLEVTGYVDTFTDKVGYNWRDGLNTSLNSTVNAQDYGDRVVDMSYIPFMRSRPVAFVAQNLKATTKFYPFFDNVDVMNYVRPADVFTVDRISNSVMSFDQDDLNNNVLADHPGRTYNGKVEQAFSVGDVLVNNIYTTNANITSIQNITAPAGAAEFTITVSDSVGLLPGHHVVLYNLDFHPKYDQKNLNDLQTNQIIPATAGLVSNATSSKEINLKKFKVKTVIAATQSSDAIITLTSIDGSTIPAFSAYSTAAGTYTSGFYGKVYRLQASCLALYGGSIASYDAIGPIRQDVYMVNIKNGFAVGDSLTGTVNIRNLSSVNGVTIHAINGSTSSSIPPVLNTNSSDIITDVEGTVAGVFYLPETNELSFRTGERTFKLTDNQSNSNASFDSIGSVVYYSQGINLTKERTIVSTRTANFVQAETYEDTQALPAVRRSTTSTRQTYQYRYDPLAQTFTVNNPGGVFVTSVDLYFAVAGKRPVSIEIRNTDNGVPSTKVVPFSQVTKPASELKKLTSTDSSVKATFKFPSPVYLQDTETYALVVMTDEPGTQLYVSEMGNQDILTGNNIAGQPLTGSLYASQNAKEWEIHTLLDMKFVLNKATFDTTTPCEVFFKGIAPEQFTLPTNPFEITPGTNLVRVYAPNHGFLAEEKVTISGVKDGCYGTADGAVGIPANILNATHTVWAGNGNGVTGIDKDSFIISLTLADSQSNTYLKGISSNASFVKGEYGGSGIMCTRSIPMDLMYFKSSDLNFNETKIQYFVKGQKESKSYDTTWTPFVPNSNYQFSTRMHIASYDNQYVESADPLIKRSSLLFKAVLESTNSSLSPAIDLQKLSAYVVSNQIDSPSSSKNNVPEIDTRKILAAGDITSTAVVATGTGTITAATSGTGVTGSGTSFTTQVVVGNALKYNGVTVGIVSSIASDTSLTLTSNALTAVTAGAFTIVSAPTYTITPSGTLTSSTSSTAITGQSTTFTTQLVVGSVLTQTNGTVIGVVASIQSNTALTLEANAKVAQTTTAFKANMAYNISFTNENNIGVITSNIDSADNLLASCSIGKTLIISNVNANVDGTYVVTNVVETDDKTTFSGNADLKATKVYVDRAFSGTVYFDAITDSDFAINVYDKFVSDIAPVGCSNQANYITRTLSLTEPADNIKIIFDGNIPNNTTVSVYYRTWSGDADLRKLPYKDSGWISGSSDAEDTFSERTIDINNLPAFSNVAVKIVMKSTNQVYVPKIKNLRLLALS